MKEVKIYVDDELLKCDSLSLCCTKDFDNEFYTNNYSLVDNEEYFEADFQSIQEHDRQLNQQIELKNLMIEIFANVYRDLLFYATSEEFGVLILEPETYINNIEECSKKILSGELDKDDIILNFTKNKEGK